MSFFVQLVACFLDEYWFYHIDGHMRIATNSSYTVHASDGLLKKLKIIPLDGIIF